MEWGREVGMEMEAAESRGGGGVPTQAEARG